eukprot:scaffold236412_cov32-Tisochrysis_lutea.AAC.2
MHLFNWTHASTLAGQHLLVDPIRVTKSCSATPFVHLYAPWRTRTTVSGRGPCWCASGDVGRSECAFLAEAVGKLGYLLSQVATDSPGLASFNSLVRHDRLKRFVWAVPMLSRAIPSRTYAPSRCDFSLCTSSQRSVWLLCVCVTPAVGACFDTRNPRATACALRCFGVDVGCSCFRTAIASGDARGLGVARPRRSV